MKSRSSSMATALAAWLVTGFLALTVSAAETAPEWFYRAWQTDEGLPANSVTGVAQTPDGRLWVATHSGLVTFDGIRFRGIALPIPGGRLNPLIRCMTQDRAHRLWLALEGGIVIGIEPNASSPRVLTSNDGLPLSRPNSMAAGSDGAVWIAYSDGLVCRIVDEKVSHPTKGDGLAGVSPCHLASDNEGNVWFIKAGRCGILEGGVAKPLYTVPTGTTRMAMALNGGVWIFGDNRLFRVQSQTNPPVAMGEVQATASGIEPTALLEDRSGAVWVGTSWGGLFRWEENQFLAINTSHANILALAEDREGNIWAGTDGGGLNRVRQRTLALQDANEGLPVPSLRSICEDGTGAMWAVAQSGELLRQTNEQWKLVAIGSGSADTRALCVSSDGHSGVWVGTYHAGVHHWDGTNWTMLGRKDGLGGEVVRGLLLDRHGDLWLAIEGSTCVQRLHQGKFQTFQQPADSRPVRAFAEDTQGNIWLGTLNGFLLRVQDNQLIDESTRTLPARNAIRCLLPTEDGSLWIGYAGAGIGRVKNNSFSRITETEGLPDPYVNAIAVDQGGSFWFGTDRGIFQVRQRELDAVLNGTAPHIRAVVYGRDEALPNLQANYGYAPGSARSRDGRIWFPMRTGLAVIHTDRVVPRRMPPAVTLEAASVDGHAMPLKPGAALRLEPQHRRIDFEYTAYSFIAPESIEFRHRLEGWEDDWSEAGTERHISYTRLPAGAYRFRVTARPRVGDWNPTEASLEFIVEPFLWQRWWFRAAALGLFTLAIIGAVRYVSFRRLRLKVARLEQEAALSRERARIAKDIHDDLGASLTQISLLSKLAEHDLDQPEKAASHLQNISTSAREGVKAVDEIVWAVNPRNDTAAHLLDYAGQFAVDFLRNAGIRCRVDFPQQVPPLVLGSDARHSFFLVVKESLNNIVKHARATDVMMLAKVERNRLVLEIRDNGAGFKPTPDNAFSDGLRNMRERLETLGGSCRISSAPGSGTTVVTELPLTGDPDGKTTN